MIHTDLAAAAEMLVNATFNGDAETSTSPADAIYAWYLNHTPLPAQGGPVLPYELSLPDALRAAHAGSSLFGGGWRAETVSTWGRVVAVSGENNRMLERSEYSVPTRRGLRAQPGDPLVVSRCWDWVEEDNGFWYTRRGEWPPPGADRLVRVYWNCPPSSAPILIKRLTEGLAPLSHSYTIKTLISPEHMGRADALVLYLGPAGYAELELEIAQAAVELADQLREPTPRLTATLGPGVGLAEGSTGGDSFGQSRSALIAEAYEHGGDADRDNVDALTQRIGETFEAVGLDPGRPHLEPRPERSYV